MAPTALLGGALRAPPVAGGATLASITSGLTQLWSDPCSAADPLVARKFSIAAMQANGQVDTSIQYPDTLSSPHAMSTDRGGPRFTQTGSGGASGGGRYTFFAPTGDTIYTSGGRGRSSLDYPVYDPGSSPAHIGPESGTNNIGFLYEGRRTITSFSSKLSSGWNLNPGIAWRLLAQWKRNEWYNVTNPDDSPVLALEQKNGNYYMIQSGQSVPGGALWTHSAAGTVNQWVRWLIDITFSQSTAIGKFRIYADWNNDGVYEYDSGLITGVHTLSNGSDVNESGLSGSVAARFPAEGIESFFSIGVYEDSPAGDSADFSDLAMYGTVGA